jgi:hypothetical protein
MFIENKYKKWYFRIIEKAISENRKKIKRSDPNFVYYESHHIIPRSLGGTEETLLTAKEHFICHLLLPKMLSGKDKYKMINALIRMTFSKSKGQERYCSRSYNIVRSFISERNSELFKDKPKSEETKSNMKGRCGKWERTEKSNLNQSFAQIKRFENSPGTFTGKKHNQESLEKRTKTRKERGIKPKFTGKGSRWYTNGNVDKMCYSDNVPEGYYLGRSKNRKEKSIELAP